MKSDEPQGSDLVRPGPVGPTFECCSCVATFCSTLESGLVRFVSGGGLLECDRRWIRAHCFGYDHRHGRCFRGDAGDGGDRGLNTGVPVPLSQNILQQLGDNIGSERGKDWGKLFN